MLIHLRNALSDWRPWLLGGLLLSCVANADIFDETPKPVNRSSDPRLIRHVDQPIFDDSPTFETLPLETLADRLSQEKGRVVLYVSTQDRACRPCIALEQQFESIRSVHTQHERIWRVNLDSAQRVTDITNPSLRALIHTAPEIIILYNGNVINRFGGAPPPQTPTPETAAAKESVSVSATPTAQDTRPASANVASSDELVCTLPAVGHAPPGIETVPIESLDERMEQIRKAYDKQIAAKKLSPEEKQKLWNESAPRILVNVSSHDPHCPPCIANNQSFEALAQRYAGRIYFFNTFVPRWDDTSAFKRNHVVTFMPTVLLFEYGNLMNQFSGYLPVDQLEKELFYRRPALDPSWYIPTNQTLDLASVQASPNVKPIWYLPNSLEDEVLMKRIADTKGVVLVHLLNHMQSFYVPTYLKKLHAKYGKKIQFIQSDDGFGRVYYSRLGQKYGLMGAPTLLLFKDARLIRRYSMNEYAGTMTLDGGEVKERQEAYAVQIDHALFD